MLGINREITQHTISLIPGMKPVKQKLCRMKPDVALKIKEEIQKQITAGLSRYPNTLNGSPTSSQFQRKTEG